MKNIKILSAAVAIAMISSFQPGEGLGFSDWDLNGDQLISRSEFTGVFKKHYVDDWNVVDDDYLDDEDFYLVNYRIWDLNKDELMTKEEWLMGYDHHYGDYIVDDFVAHDVDGDGYIEYAEFRDALMNTEYYVVWDIDADTYLSEDELATAVFNSWDIDNSSFIEKDEYKIFDAYYRDF